MKPYYQDDYATIWNADCRDVLAMIPPIDLCVTSPPYDNLRDYEGCDWDFGVFSNVAYLLSQTTDNIVWIVGDASSKGGETGTSFRQALYFMRMGYKLHDTMIWQKSGFSMPSNLHGRYHQTFEYMFIFKMDKIPFNGIEDRKNVTAGAAPMGQNTTRSKSGTMGIERPRKAVREYGLRNNIWKTKSTGQENPCKAIEHPATFPLRLAYDHIVTWSNPDHIVVDPFMGSGTTIRAAKDAGRKAIGIEISEKYCEIAANRMQQEVLPL